VISTVYQDGLICRETRDEVGDGLGAAGDAGSHDHVEGAHSREYTGGSAREQVAKSMI
jgi:hypothetical protein